MDYAAIDTYGGIMTRGNSINVGKFTIGSWTQSAPFNGLYVSGDGYFASNVGIGTTSPGAKLDVAGTVKADNLSVASTISGTGRLHIGGGELLYILNTAGVMIGKEWGGNGNLRVQGDSIFDGNVGIGTANVSYSGLQVGNGGTGGAKYLTLNGGNGDGGFVWA